MKFCSNCGANVEGLIFWYDCCGAPLVNDDYIIAHSLYFEEYGDIGRLIAAVVERLNQKNLSTVIPSISKIELVTYCYPSALVQELNLRNRSRLTKKTKKATITIVFDSEFYAEMTANEKEAYVEQTILSALSDFLNKHNLASAIESIQSSEDTEAVSLSDLIQTILFDGGISAAQNKILKEDPNYLEGCTDTNIPESDLCELILLAQRDKNTARYLPNIVDSVADAAITRRVFELLFHFPKKHIRDSLIVSLSHKTLDIASLAELCETNTCFECYFTWIMELYRDPCATCEELSRAIDRFLACPFSYMAKEVYQETRELDKDYEVSAEKQAAVERLLDAAK